MDEKIIVQKIRELASGQSDSIIGFLSDIVKIPSAESQIKMVGERISDELNKLGFSQIHFDVQGNLQATIGEGPRLLVYDSHIDTVGVGDRENWIHDPYAGVIENGRLYGRGVCDEKSSTPGMAYGLSFARELGLLDGVRVTYFGNMEEWCDGIAPRVFCEHDPALKPDAVLIGEPTNLRVYRGHKGRIELRVKSFGKSAHAASNYLGVNTIYQLIPVIEQIQQMEKTLHTDPFLGQGRITVSDMNVSTPSINAVPDYAEILIDRRLTFGESAKDAFNQVKEIVERQTQSRLEVEVLSYSDPSYTGFCIEAPKVFPAWALDEDHALVQAGHEIRQIMGLAAEPAGKWDFSTNGTYWAGIAGIPSIGFAPGDERLAHAPNEYIELDEVIKSVEFYAMFPHIYNRFSPKK